MTQMLKNIAQMTRKLNCVITLLAALLLGCAAAPSPTVKTSESEIVKVDSLSPTGPCIDIDQDNVCDEDDRCPTVSGLAAAFGCPIEPCNGAPLLVLVQFNYDSSTMPAKKSGGVQTMDSVLDAVAEAISKDSSCRVCIVGHASEEGTAEYNEELSRRRAFAVQEYLVHHDLAKIRMPVTGMGERCQLVPEKSRELNRRVEFRRVMGGESCPTVCSD